MSGAVPLAASSWLAWALMSALFAALTAISAKIGLREVDSDLATLIRTAVIALVLAALLAVNGKLAGASGLGWRTSLFLALSGLATGASWLCHFRALKMGDASRVAPVDKMSVVIVAPIGSAFLGEHPSARAWTGLALIGAGVVLVAVG